MITVRVGSGTFFLPYRPGLDVYRGTTAHLFCDGYTL